jgi:hypothetical protein
MQLWPSPFMMSSLRSQNSPLVVPRFKRLGQGHTILTSRELMWCYACISDILTLNSGAHSHFCQLCLRHVIWRAALVGSRTSTPLKFLLSYAFRETWRTCRVLFRHCYQLLPEMEEMLVENCANGPLYTQTHIKWSLVFSKSRSGGDVEV